MLDQHDLQMITEIVCNAVRPLQADIAEMRADIEMLKAGQAEMRADIEALKEGQQRLSDRVRNVEVILENDVRHSVRIVAENHINLSKKFDQALEIARYDEMQKLRLVYLESEVRVLKNRMDAMETKSAMAG